MPAATQPGAQPYSQVAFLQYSLANWLHGTRTAIHRSVLSCSFRAVASQRAQLPSFPWRCFVSSRCAAHCLLVSECTLVPCPSLAVSPSIVRTHLLSLLLYLLLPLHGARELTEVLRFTPMGNIGGKLEHFPLAGRPTPLLCLNLSRARAHVKTHTRTRSKSLLTLLLRQTHAHTHKNHEHVCGFDSGGGGVDHLYTHQESHVYKIIYIRIKNHMYIRNISCIYVCMHILLEFAFIFLVLLDFFEQD